MSPDRVFLFGKLPSHGDFVSRGLDAEAQKAWDDRCTDAIADARARLGDDFDAVYEATPPRGFLLAPCVDAPDRRIGCIASSRDRVGRAFPLVIGIVGPPEPSGYDAPIVAHLESCLYGAILGERDIADTIDLAAAYATAIRDDAALDAVGTVRSWDRRWIGASAPSVESMV